MSTSNQEGQEVLCEGWLIKSPPTKRIWRARWRKRWFALRQSGQIPDQYILEYYTDRNCRKLKGKIDLDQVDQVDIGLHYEQLKYKFMFDIKTPNRTYYLAAESEQERNQWVEYICQICGLKDHEADIVLYPVEPTKSNISGPYIYVSDCHSGKPLNKLTNDSKFLDENTVPLTPFTELAQQRQQQSCRNLQDSEWNSLYNNNSSMIGNDRFSSSSMIVQDLFYDSPRKHTTISNPLCSESYAATNNSFRSFTMENYSNLPSMSLATTPSPTNNSLTLPSRFQSPKQFSFPTQQNQQHRSLSPSLSLQSPITDTESIFSDESIDCQNGNCQQHNHRKSFIEEDNEHMWEIKQKFTKINLKNDDGDNNKQQLPLPPPRPPKPGYLVDSAIQSKNLDGCNKIKENIDSNSTNENNNKSVVMDEMYDFPRSHNDPGENDCIYQLNDISNDQQQSNNSSSTLNRHCYNNAAPVSVPNKDTSGTLIFRYDDSPSSTTPTKNNSHIFRYDKKSIEDTMSNKNSQSIPSTNVSSNQDEPPSPCSQSSHSSATMYSNLPSPLLDNIQQNKSLTPPAINRELKPRINHITNTTQGGNEKISKTNESSTTSAVPFPLQDPPAIDRKLKPANICSKVPHNFQDIQEYGNIRKRIDSTSPGYVFEHSDSQFLKPLDSPGNASITSSNLGKLQYLDLDLDVDSSNKEISPNLHHQLLKSTQELSSSVYKTVDFVQTDALQRTKKSVEEQRMAKYPSKV